jgi:hypothetical protein
MVWLNVFMSQFHLMSIVGGIETLFSLQCLSNDKLQNGDQSHAQLDSLVQPPLNPSSPPSTRGSTAPTRRSDMTPTSKAGHLPLMHKATRARFPETHRRSLDPYCSSVDGPPWSTEAISARIAGVTSRTETKSGDLPLRLKCHAAQVREAVGRAVGCR